MITFKSDAQLRVLLAIAIALFVIIVTLFIGINTTGNSRDLLPYRSKPLVEYLQAKKIFFPNPIEPILVEISDDASNIRLKQLTDALIDITGVISVYSPIIETDLPIPFTLEGSGNNLARILVEIDQNLTKLHEIESKIQTTLQSFADLKPILYGAEYISMISATAIKEDLFSLLPAAGLLITLVIALLFRNIYLACALMMPAIISLAFLLLPLALFKIPLGFISSLAPIIVFVLASCYSVTAYLESRSEIKDFHFTPFKAIYFSVISTIIGFLCLSVSGVLELIRFASLIAWGLLISTIAIRLLLIPYLRTISAEPNLNKIFDHFIHSKRISYILLSWPIGLITTVCIFLIAFKAQGLPVSSTATIFLPKNSTESALIQAAEKSNATYANLHLLIQRTDKEKFSTEDYQLIEQLSIRVEKHVDILSAASIASYTDLENKNYPQHVKNSLYLKEATYLNQDQTIAHILLNTKAREQHLIRVNDQILNLAKSYLGLFASEFSITDLDQPNWEKTFEDIPRLAIPHDTPIQSTANQQAANSDAPLSHQISLLSFEGLLFNQLERIPKGIIFALALLAIMITAGFAYFLRSTFFVFMAIIPNVLTVAAFYGLAALLYDHLTLASAIVPVIALALAVDHTINFLLTLKALPKTEESVLLAHQQLGFSMLVSSFIIVFGCLVMTFSQIEPISQFGTLLALTLVLGALADSVILPQIMRYIYRFNLLPKH